MSNYLGVGAVTATIQKIIYDAVTADVGGSDVSVGNPADYNASGGVPTVNVFLYQAVPNAQLRNHGMPTRSSVGARLLNRPEMPLDLHYLLTFHGNHENLEPERLMGRTAVALESHAVLTSADIAAGIAMYTGSPGVIDDSDLADQVDRVRLTPVTLDIDQLTNLWSAFPDTSFISSLVVVASAVLLKDELSTQKPYPVSTASLYVLTFQQPVITSVENSSSSLAPILDDSTIVIRGSGLAGDSTTVRIDDVEKDVGPSEARSTEITVSLTADEFWGVLEAGIRVVEVVHKIDMEQGESTVAHVGATSNSYPIVLRPSIEVGTGAVAVGTTESGYTSGTITVAVSPPVGDDQQTRMLLNSLDDSTVAYTLLDGQYDVSSGDILFDFIDVLPGDYLVRLQVDGAQSIPEQDPTTELYSQPSVTIP